MRLWTILFFVLPLVGTIYVSWRIWHIVPFGNVGSCLSVGLVWLGLGTLLFNFLVGLDGLPMPLARVSYEFGTSWLFIMLYMFMLFLVLDLGRLVRIVPQSFLIHSTTGTLVVAALMVVLFVYANRHYRNKMRVPLTLKTEKRVEGTGRIVMMSDLHLGYHNPRKELARWVDLVNKEAPDLILIAGDIIDVSVRPLIEEDMAKEFRRLKAPVYACLGNHEYYSGEPRARQFYQDAGIHLLIDTAVVVGDVCVIGRDDRTNPHRASLGKIMKTVDKGKYMILLDHQPYHLEQAERWGIDCQFSGHTHYGQVWPINWVTDMVYENAFGPYQRGKTQYYVSSGLGIWGGKFRIGTQSEYVVAEIKNAY